MGRRRIFKRIKRFKQIEPLPSCEDRVKATSLAKSNKGTAHSGHAGC